VVLSSACAPLGSRKKKDLGKTQKALAIPMLLQYNNTATEKYFVKKRQIR
jgi:hypothetical protein